MIPTPMGVRQTPSVDDLLSEIVTLAPRLLAMKNHLLAQGMPKNDQEEASAPTQADADKEPRKLFDIFSSKQDKPDVAEEPFAEV